MKYRIHYWLTDGSEDSFILSGDSIEGIQQKAAEELSRRGGTGPWSEKIA